MITWNLDNRSSRGNNIYLSQLINKAVILADKRDVNRKSCSILIDKTSQVLA